ncbi:MAG: FAD:protein FMN transferase [Planctomycetota bacterium]
MNRITQKPRNVLVAWFSFFQILLFQTTLCLAEEPVSITGTTMGPIVFEVTVVSPPDGFSKDSLEPEINAALERVNSLMSTYIATSDVSRFNESDSIEWFEVEQETASVVARSIEISELTGGAFDITVSPAVALWDFGSGAGEVELPTDDEITAVKSITGFELIEARLEPPAIKKQNSNVQIDLSAIAKGYAVDAVAEVLTSAGCENYLVVVGGEVFAAGNSPKGEAWRLGIEKPVVDRREPDSIASLNGQAMATSGDYRNFHMIDGRAYSHTIDPSTCRPVDHALASATVIANDCMTADALATAAMVLGEERAGAVCDEVDAHWLFITRKDPDPRVEAGFERTSSDGFPEVQLTSNESGGSDSILPVFFAAAIVFGLAILGMAVGSIFANKPVQGSCGGLSAMAGESECGICSKPVTDCVEQQSETTVQDDADQEAGG